MEPNPSRSSSFRSYWIGPIYSELLIALLPLLNFYAVVYPRLPDQVAIHFDANGVANRFVDKHSMEVVIVFAAMGIFGFLFGKMIRIIMLTATHLSQNENNKRICARITNYVEFFTVILFSFFCLDTQKLSLGQTGNPDFIIKTVFIGINILLLLIGNISPKVTPNKCLGIKTPYAFSSEEAWVRVQRFGGKLLTYGCLFNILATILLPLPFIGIIIFNVASILLQAAFLFFWKPSRQQTSDPS